MAKKDSKRAAKGNAIQPDEHDSLSWELWESVRRHDKKREEEWLKQQVDRYWNAQI
jgi:hypothetical protein